ncbi:GH25 family lysozyme M1 (1,4-beta-N-acetylmuramidase) [Bifidobacterium commune]|nr:RICIN domain-containing protein [Bifidobacterium commune]MBB2955436.1 GH25 family lysozyme M1 (1,4-beta-N-acetylmuramidase) [Bifidobacterium commune]
MKGMNMQGKMVAWVVKGTSVLTASALGMALTVIPAVAATDTNLSGFDAAGIESQSYNSGTDGRFGNKDQAKTIGNQKMVANVEASKDAMPDNPSQRLPDKVSTAVPDDATVISKDLAATKDGQVKDLKTGEVVTDPKLVGTEDTPPDPLEVTGGRRFIPVDASEVKEAVGKNDGDASAAADAGAADSAATPSKATDKGNVHTAALQNNQYGAYWGRHNNTQAFFERGGNLFVQQAKGVVDVSEHQGGIDWQTAKNSGVEGAIIRIGFGWGNRMDRQAARNVSECKRLGIPFGVYLYSYAYDNNSARAEGNDVVNKLRQLGVSPGDLTFPVYYDLERWSWTGHTPPTNPWVYDGMVNTWYGCLQSNGYNNLSIYSYTSYLNTSLNTGNIRAKTRWVASYGSRTGFGFSSNDRAWQYADNGGIKGINGNVDLNAFGNYSYVSSAADISGHRAASLPNDTYYISSLLRDSAGLDIPGGSGTNGAKIQLYDANQTAAQQYKLTRHGDDGTYEIRNVNSGKALDVPSGNAYRGASVQQWDPNGSNAQRWYLRNTGQGGMYIQSKLGNFVLDLPCARTGNGTGLNLWEPNYSQAQQFLFSTVVDLPSEYLRFSSVINSSALMDVSGASESNGARVQMYAFNDTDAQKFRLRLVGNSIYEIINANSGKVVDLSGASVENGTRIQQYTRNNTCSQHWLVRQQGVGQYSFYSGCAADKVIDIPSGWAKNGVGLQIYDGNGSAAQKWWLTPVKTSWQYADDLAAAHRSEIADGVYSFGSKNRSSQVLDVSGGSLGNGARVQLYGRNGSGAQSWRISHDSTGYVTLTNTQSGKALDIPGALGKAGVALQQYQPNDTRAQKWIVVKDGDAYKFMSATDTNLVLDISRGLTANGTALQLYYNNDTGAQRWVSVK